MVFVVRSKAYLAFLWIEWIDTLFRRRKDRRKIAVGCITGDRSTDFL